MGGGLERGLGKGGKGHEEEAFPVTPAEGMVVWHNQAVAMGFERKGLAGGLFREGNPFNSVASLMGG